MKRISKLIFLITLPAIILIILNTNSYAASNEPQSFRHWWYVKTVHAITPNWSFLVVPGGRYELAKSHSGSRAEAFLFEFITGPMFSKKWGNIQLDTPLFYYLLFSVDSSSESTYHQFDLMPKVTYTLGKVTFSYKLYLGNRFYSDQAGGHEGAGYSLLTSNLVGITFTVNENFAAFVKEEFFVLAKEDADNPDAFYGQAGLNRNRVHIGANYKLLPSTKVEVAYIYESAYNPVDLHLTEVNHYIRTILTYVVKFYKTE